MQVALLDPDGALADGANSQSLRWRMVPWSEEWKGGAGMAIELQEQVNGIWTAPCARIIDRAGLKHLPIGDDGFGRAAAGPVPVDKTALIVDVLDSGYTSTLFCCPRRFSKTLNMTVMKDFFEAAPAGLADLALFEGTEVWGMGGASYREHFAA